MGAFWKYLQEQAPEILAATGEHLGISLLALVLACLVAVPLGIAISRRKSFASGVLGIAGVLQTIPSIALLGALIPLLGIGVVPAILALVLYAILPILRNTYTGIIQVDPAVTEAARGMGMTNQQILWQVELPLAMPVLLAGIRTAAVINVGVATLAAYIGAGGLGGFIFKGISLNNGHMILAGAIPAALLAILMDQVLGGVVGRKTRRSTLWLLLGVVVIGGFLSFWKSQVDTTQTENTVALSAAFDPEFADRADGMPSVLEKYPGLSFDYRILNAGFLYEAVANKEIDVISGYSTDGRVQAYQLRVLEDDQHAFPPYECAVLANGDLLRNQPELSKILGLLEGKISDSLMTAMNFAVDHEQQDPTTVARTFLETLSLYRPNKTSEPEGTVIIGSKLFTEQYILAAIFQQLIEGYTDLQVGLKTGLGGTKICYEALKKGDIHLYPEYSGTGFQVILNPPDSIRQAIFTDAEALFTYVRETCLKQDDTHWLAPLGFNNTYALMVRDEQAAKAGWTKISNLLD